MAAFETRPKGSGDEGIKKIFATALTETSATDKEGLGTIRFVGRKVYKWIKYNSGTGPVAAVAGNFVTYHGDNGSTDQEVTGDATDGGKVGAGVLQAVIATGEYGWIQIAGEAILTTALTAGADGNSLTPIGAGDGTLDVSALVSDHLCAIAIDASAKIVLLQCPF